MRKSTEDRRRKRKAATKELEAVAAARLHNEDRISQLPDDILISIISRLTLREATATSILSTRWRYLYTYTTRLDFPPFKPLPYPRANKFLLQEIQEKRFPDYMNMINHILDSHKGGGIKEFRVHMPCLEGANIERWLEFALARKVEIIDIHMRWLVNSRRGHYSLQLSNLITNGGRSLPGLKCLKELSLVEVHVDDGEVELLLSSFPLLESLSLERSRGLTNILIVGHSLLLKHLGISSACNLRSIEISNMSSLISLRCYNLPPTYVLRLNDVPKLIDFSTSDVFDNTLAKILTRIPSCIHDQLRLLKLSTNPYYMSVSSQTYMFPQLINIKHLEMEVEMRKDDHDIFPLLRLVEACPSLEILEIKFSWELNDGKFEDTKIRKYFLRKKLSPNLKKLKLSGYLGRPSELEFALFILNNVVAFEELIVEPCDVTKDIQRTSTARARKHFPLVIPNSVNLVII